MSRRKVLNVSYPGITLLYGIPIDEVLYNQLPKLKCISLEVKANGKRPIDISSNVLDSAKKVKLSSEPIIEENKQENTNEVENGNKENKDNKKPQAGENVSEEDLSVPIPDTNYSVQSYQDGSTLNTLYFLQFKSQLVYDDLKNTTVQRIHCLPTVQEKAAFVDWVKKFIPSLDSSQCDLYRVLEIVLEKYTVLVD